MQLALPPRPEPALRPKLQEHGRRGWIRFPDLTRVSKLLCSPSIAARLHVAALRWQRHPAGKVSRTWPARASRCAVELHETKKLIERYKIAPGYMPAYSLQGDTACAGRLGFAPSGACRLTRKPIGRFFLAPLSQTSHQRCQSSSRLGHTNEYVFSRNRFNNDTVLNER